MPRTRFPGGVILSRSTVGEQKALKVAAPTNEVGRHMPMSQKESHRQLHQELFQAGSDQDCIQSHQLRSAKSQPTTHSGLLSFLSSLSPPRRHCTGKRVAVFSTLNSARQQRLGEKEKEKEKPRAAVTELSPQLKTLQTKFFGEQGFSTSTAFSSAFVPQVREANPKNCS